MNYNDNENNANVIRAVKLYYVTQLSNYGPLWITEIAATIPDA
jgi:hypothetical protein